MASLERVSELDKRLHEGRRRPSITSGPAETLWGELRSLGAHTFEGGERWEDWQPLLRALPDEAQREAAYQYLARAWGLSQRSEDDVRGAFKLRRMAAHAPQLRQCRDFHGLLLPPADEQELIAWEQRWQMTMPLTLRDFFTQVSAGYEVVDELTTLNLRPPDDEAEPLVMAPHGKLIDAWDEGELGWYQDVMERILAQLERDPTPRTFELPLASEEDAARAPEVFDSMIVVESFFEGHHGDWLILLITQGPLAGKLLTVTDAIHAGEDGEGCVIAFEGTRFEDWLHDHLYHEGVLGLEPDERW